jgi:tetrahydromethanopterin S-methyltransferase subunit E
MTPRSGLYVALVGLVMAGLCFAALFLLRDWNPDGSDRVMIMDYGFIIFLDLGALLGLIVMVVGLVMAGVLALTKQSGKPS